MGPSTPQATGAGTPTTDAIQARRPGEAAAPVPRPVSRPSDSVATSLSPASVAAEPGGIALATIRVRNTGTVVDELRITVDGPAAPWAEVETPVLRLMPATDGTSVIRLRPPVVPLALAGQVGFTVRVASRQHPAELASESGVLTVGEVRALAATIVPATAKASGSATYEVRVENRGNLAAAVTLAATDPDEALDLAIDTAPVMVQAGETLRASLRAKPRAGIMLGAPERRTFSVTVASEGRTAAQAGGTLVQVARLPAWAPMAAAIAGGVAVLAIAGFALGIIPPKGDPSPSAVANVPSQSAGPGSASPTTESPSPVESASSEPTEAAPTDEPTPTPTDEPTPEPTPTPLPPDACVDGYAWRLVIPGDHVCVVQLNIDQVQADNAVAPTRWTDGAFGPHTCIDGYLWRNAVEGDDVCVSPEVYALTQFDNQAGPFRVAPRGETCIAGFAWREATFDDHVCVEPWVRQQTISDNLQAQSRWIDGAFGPQTCVDGYVWRVVVESDLVCVTPDVRDQVQADNAAAQGRIAGE
jgi:hypothetical protein